TSGTATDITADTTPGGYIWFTEGYGNRIGRISADGTLTEFPLALAALAIALHSDGNAWFVTAQNRNEWIGRITPLGQVTEIPFPTVNINIPDIASGPDGNLWLPFGDNPDYPNQIARLSPSTSRFVTFPSSVVEPDQITSGPDGAVWFTEQFTNDIGR